MSRDSSPESGLASKLAKSTYEIITKDIPDFCAEAWGSFKYAAVQSPLTGATQLADRVLGTKLQPAVQFMDKQPESKTWSGWLGQQSGALSGMSADFMFLGKTGALLKWITGARTAAHTLSLADKTYQAARLGFWFDAICKPVENANENFWLARLRHGAVGGLTFGAVTGSTLGLQSQFLASAESGLAQSIPRLGHLLSNKTFTGGISGLLSGIPGGLTNANANALLSTGDFASWKDAGKSVLEFSVIGGLMGAGHGFIDSLGPSKSEIATINQIHEKLIAHGRKEMTRWGYSDIAAELINKQNLQILSPHHSLPELLSHLISGNHDGSYSSAYDQITVNRNSILDKSSPRNVFDKAGQEAYLLGVVSHELRHRVNFFERTTLKMADPQGYRNTLIEEVICGVGLGGKRLGSMIFPEERLLLNNSESSLLRDLLRKYLKESKSPGELAPAPLLNFELQDWIAKQNLSNPISTRLLTEMRKEIQYAHRVMELSTLPDKFLAQPENEFLLSKLQRKAQQLRESNNGSLEHNMQKYLQSLSTDTVGRMDQNYYLFSVEEIRARRQEQSLKLRMLVDEIKDEIRTQPELAKKLLHPRTQSDSNMDFQSVYLKEIRNFIANTTPEAINPNNTSVDRIMFFKSRTEEPSTTRITDKLRAIDEIIKDIRFQNAMEIFQKDYANYLRISDTTLFPSRNSTSNTLQTALQRMNTSLVKLLGDIPLQRNYPHYFTDYTKMGQFTSRLLDFGIPVKTLLELTPLETIGGIAVGLHPRYSYPEILSMTPVERWPAVSKSLLDINRISPYEMMESMRPESVQTAADVICQSLQTDPARLPEYLVAVAKNHPLKSVLELASQDSAFEPIMFEQALLSIQCRLRDGWWRKDIVPPEILHMLNTPPSN